MELQDVARLSAALERIARRVRGADLPGGLSSIAASTLYVLATEGPTRLTALADAEHVTQPAMTQLVRRLEREGLVERRHDPSDGRAVLVAATDAGAALSAERRAARADALAAVLEEVDADERAALAAALPALEHLAANPAPSSRALQTPR
ncbi:MarR family winged helix-turn-helix transcriptional regulator [Agrococcus sp. SGAir0287]|uniref:MarR family winged helix-turn-helix transcriptional regulator n=1 Tax=Agrococcus sp. SGAir0287 TaxID=2070347 RepID=UPI001C30ADA9|nr:MarR family transcriptional regulator [Agrococcus sp. SGAir0287]